MSFAEIKREYLVNQTKAEFQNAGYSLWNEMEKSNIFDFIAKKTEILDNSLNQRRIVTKVIVDLDLFKKSASIELQLISKLISGFPLVIANTADGKKIEEETLYRRHQVAAISLRTLQKFFQFEKGKTSAKISKFAHRGGVYVNLSKDKFKAARRESKYKNMTYFAEKTGISRHSLYRYEKGQSFPKASNYNMICDILECDDLDIPLDILEIKFNGLCEDSLQDYKKPRSKLQKEVGIYLAEKDFNVLWFKSEPFDGLSEPNIEKIGSNKGKKILSPIITGVTTNNKKDDIYRLFMINSLSGFLKKRGIWFIEDDIDDIESSEESPYVSILNISDLEGMAVIDFLKLLKKQKS